MSHTSSTDPSSNFRSMFDEALEAYKNKTGKDLPSHPLFRDITACASPEAVLAVLRKGSFDPGLGQSGSSHDTSRDWLLATTVDVLNQVLQTVGASVGLVYPPAGVIFTAIGILLAAVKAVNASPSASQGALAELFYQIKKFFSRLDTYTKVTPTAEMKEVIVKVMAEVLFILAVATRIFERGKMKTFFISLVRNTEIEDALGRLDKLTQEEALTMSAQALKSTHGVASEVQCVRDRMQGVDDRVRGVDDKVKGIDDRVKGLEGKGNAFLDVLDKSIEQMANSPTSLDRNKLRQALREWLSPPDPSVNHNIAFEAHHAGTATWFTEGQTFADWKQSGSFMWVHGMPGSGKTVLSSMIIQNIKSISDTGSAYMAYFFFDFKDKGKQDVHALLSSFLVQLADQSDACCDKLLTLYSSHRRGSELQKPVNGALTQCLEEMFMILGQVPIYLIIDALDESPDGSGIPPSRGKVLQLVKRLVELHFLNLHIVATSRPESDIRTVLEPLTCTSISIHEQDGQKSDIVDYISYVVYSDLNMKRWQEDDKKLVVKTLSNRAGGMFRWVYCQLERLRRCLAPSVRRILDELPDTIDETYSRVLREIANENRDQAYRLLQCLTVAVRPLHVEELAEVLAVDFSAGGVPTLNVDLRWENQEQAIVVACSSLIAIVEYRGSRIVQFSHFSVKEFLTSERLAALQDASHYHIDPEPAHTVMAQACLAVLLRLDYNTDEGSMKSFPLANYAATHFSSHAEFGIVISQIGGGIDCLLDGEKPHFASWLWARNPWRGTRNPQPSQEVPLYWVANLGFPGMVQHLISKRPQDVNARSGLHGTPFQAAVARGHVKVAQVLLAHCVDMDVWESDGQTPLHLASDRGHLDMVQWLLDGDVDVNGHRKKSRTPPHPEARHKFAKFARMLLVRNTDVSTRGNYCRTPLHLASRGGHCDIMRVLLERGADVDVQDTDHSTPLHEALSQWEVKAAELLLEYGANVHMRNSQSQTPLHLASRCGYRSIMRVLLEQGTDVDVQDTNHSTPLHEASSQLKVEAAELLLEYGANVHMRNSQGKTPLHLASWGGYRSIMWVLLERGADVDVQDTNHSTPLHEALSQSEVDAAELLLEYGADVHMLNSQGQTPLHIASGRGYRSIMRVLLERGVDVDVQNTSHSTPLHEALSQSEVDAAELLLEYGANVHIQNSQGKTPLHLASCGGYGSIMRVILERSADVDVQDTDHSTPLHVASSQSKVEAPELLLECGANVHMRNSQGQIALHLASRGGYRGIMRVLLEQGTDVDVQDANHSTPLHEALSQRKVDAAELLLEYGANIHMRNSQGKTPLHLASRRRYGSIMRVLLEQGADVDVQDADYWTPLHEASSQSEVEAAELLLEYGANVYMQTSQGETPLHLASWGGYGSIMRVLLEQGADVDMQDTDHWTPLHEASSQSEVEAARLLLEYGANVHMRTSQGETPLHLASRCGDCNIMRVLLERGADVDVQNTNHSTPLHEALSLGEVEAAELLLGYGANVHMRNNQGETPLHLASRAGKRDIMWLLLDRGADVDAQDEHRSTPLHVALQPCAEAKAAVLQLLLDCGANPNFRDERGRTPLLIASRTRNEETKRLLLDYVPSHQKISISSSFLQVFKR